MTTQQTEALRLAELLEWDNTHDLRVQAAAELRRLHEENERHKTIIKDWLKENAPGGWIDELRTLNQELLEALKSIAHYAERQVAAFNTGVPYLDMTLFPRLCDAARAAIAKAEGETK